MSMSPPTAGSQGSRGGAGMWEGGGGNKAPSPPVSSERRAGIGCKINTNDKNELFVREVIPGGPAALSCEIANGDVLLSVDGVMVMGETPEEVARRIVGPEGQPITMAFRIKRRSEQGSSVVEKNVTLVRQQPFTMSDRLITGQVGLGVELAKVDGGLMEVRKLADGGSACLSGRLVEGDIITSVDGRDISQMPSAERPQQLLGTPYTRLTLSVVRATPQGRKHLVLDLVRTVPLQGEYLLKYAAYRNALAHAILPPVPPPQLHHSGGGQEVGGGA
uniref:PDZ domain-containing protein n=1 Tax=Hemiselmis andersenii TaxID=464988 RepID=A0A7S1EKM4_HEMAN|mmetsp:Transcript_52944/g.128300  ORF Transcript_52944/g.128300 Transcript_52944/m.128300 type:complete len:276 (+) Transcript_52944:465-1292(+)